MIDFVKTVKATDVSSISTSLAFSPLALNRLIVAFVSVCHPTNGMSDPIGADLAYGSSTAFLRRESVGGNPNNPGPRPWPAVRQYLWSSSMNEVVPLSGTVSAGFTTPIHAIMTVIGLNGANFTGVEDTDRIDSIISSFATLPIIAPVDFPPGFAGFAARQKPLEPVWVAGAALDATPLVLESFPGAGAGYPSHSIWTAPTFGSWAAYADINQIQQFELAATGFSFLGGLAELAPGPPSNLEPLSRYAREEIAFRMGVVIGKDRPWKLPL